jgi:hypothetical protein
MKMARSTLGKALGILALAIVLTSGTAFIGLANPAYADLQLIDNGEGATECGNVGFSSDGLGQLSDGGTIQAEVLAGSTIEQAFLYGVTYTTETIPTIDVTFDGTAYTLTRLANNEHVYLETYRVNVTTQVATKIGASGGIFDFVITGDFSGLDGVALVVIYSNPALPQGCIAILDGGLAPTPAQTTTVGFAEPIDKSVSGFQAIMAIGSSFGYQGFATTHECGNESPQGSEIDVNGAELTSCAGNHDDAKETTGANGNLITVGGIGDDLLNPSNPSQEAADGTLPRTIDDELYNIASFIDDGDTQVEFVTENSSTDDNLFLLVLAITAQASVGEICGDDIDNDEDGQTDEGCEVYNLSLFEGSNPSDLVLDLGDEAKAVADTNDASVTQVVFTWIDPSSNPDQTTTVPVVAGEAEDTFTPDEVGTWTVVADFGNGVVVIETLDIDFMVIPESAVGTLALVVSSLAAMGAFYGIRMRGKGKI